MHVPRWGPAAVLALIGFATCAAAETVPPVVTVTSPNGGETWGAGTAHAITWTATDNVAVVAIDLYYRDAESAEWNPIALGISNTGSSTWYVPNLPTAAARIRVVAWDPSGNPGAMAAAIAGVRNQIAFYGSTPAYRAVLELHGWADAADELYRLSRSDDPQRWSAMGSVVDDDMLHAFAVVGFEFELSVPPDVIEMPADRAQVIAVLGEHFDHDFRHPPDCPVDGRDLAGGEMNAALGTAAAMGDEVEQWPASTQVKKRLRHTRLPSWQCSL